ILGRLRDVYASPSLAQWPTFYAIVDELCRLESSGPARAVHRFAQAEAALVGQGNEPRALAFLELALDEDPQHDRARSTFVALRTRREEWAALAQVYERLCDR